MSFAQADISPELGHLLAAWKCASGEAHAAGSAGDAAPAEAPVQPQPWEKSGAKKVGVMQKAELTKDFRDSFAGARPVLDFNSAGNCFV